MAVADVSRIASSNLQCSYPVLPRKPTQSRALGFFPFECHSDGSQMQRGFLKFRSWRQSIVKSHASAGTVRIGVEEWVKEVVGDRLQHLQDQALAVLKKTVDTFENPAFPCALIAGDVVILDLLNKLGVLSNGRVKVIFIDTFHLFPETYDFLHSLEERYGFKAHVFHAAGVNSKEEYVEKYDTDLFIRDIEEYDRICKVEPFDRSLNTLKVDAMINGRRRDHGADRAHLEVVEGDKRVKIQPLAYWEFRDVWNYLKKFGIPYHPLHDDGYPSIGDVQSTLPVPRENWFEYGGERSGRFQGLTNKDGSVKTECGIHVEGPQ